MEYALEKSTLMYRQQLPLEVKIKMTKIRVQKFVEEYGIDGVYMSFSGGKDSTVLMDICRELYPEMEAVFLDTWMEFPQVRQHVHKYSNVTVIKPQGTPKQLIERCGWCFPSKDVAEMIEAARRDKPWAIRKLNGLNSKGEPEPFREQYKKWWKLVDAPFKISPWCCDEMKEKPVQKYEKETGKHPILALMAEESARREDSYLKTGCNAFESARPVSKPMGFWTEQDVLKYILTRNLPLASPYGCIMEAGQVEGQMSFCMCGKLKCSGESRTGCMFCMIGCHLDNFAKLKRLKQYDSKLYDYCMEELGEKEVVEWIKRNILRK